MAIVYSLIEMAGKHRLAHLGQYLVTHTQTDDDTDGDCESAHRVMDEMKIKNMKGLGLLGSLEDEVGMEEGGDSGKEGILEERLERAKK